ncbi:MAG: hypothetical protein KTR20_12745 [Cellvibrionaceae bacterium]|nr:hypothetical protein [Cellvibrionaceae bacterium]
MPIYYPADIIGFFACGRSKMAFFLRAQGSPIVDKVFHKNNITKWKYIFNSFLIPFGNSYYLFGNVELTDMSIEEIRRANFARLRVSYKLSEISDKTGIPQTYLTRIQRDYRSFTEKKARQIEEGLELPRLWMDKIEANEDPKLQSRLDELWSMCQTDQQREVALAALEAVIKASLASK